MTDATCKECGAPFKAQRRGSRIQQHCSRDCSVASARRKGCAFPGCPAPHYAFGWCHKHWARWRKHGDPAVTLKREYQRIAGATLAERFWAKVDKGDGTGCWLWTGHVMDNGYGQVNVDGHLQLVHRVAYELLIGPIPDGLPLDHVKANGCTSTTCVKAIADEHGPAHLEPVTHLENMRRGSWATRTHCPRGHPYDEANTYVTSKGHRQCRTCNEMRARARRDGSFRSTTELPCCPTGSPDNSDSEEQL